VRAVAVGLRSAAAILIAGTGIGLAVDSANAETAAPTAQAEPEAPDSADSGARDPTPSEQRAERRRERRELRPQRWAKRLAHAREVLFDGIELSAEQSRGVDAIIEGELKVGQRSGELEAELETARQQGGKERVRAIRKEGRAVRARRKGPNESMEEMRALLSEEQRSIFDMNRARLAAERKEPKERQEPKKRRRKRRPRADAEVKVEGVDAEVEAEGASAEVNAEGADAEVKAEGADAEVKAEGADAEAEAE
jgi:hypothetical protein